MELFEKLLQLLKKLWYVWIITAFFAVAILVK